MTTSIDVLLIGWGQNLRQAEALLADVPGEKMTYQPAGVVNHPAWVLSHLIHYHPAIISLVRGERVSDPGQHPAARSYDAGSVPVDSPALYPSQQELLARYREGHERIADELQGLRADRLDRPPGLPRWAESFGSSAAALTYLMVFHEAVHLGQLMVWRRALGLSPLE